jgi:hypothetical protein
VLAVSTAFREGKYGGTTFSGEYGDMAATVAAILLDPEARATILDLDPKHGSLREPILKVMHMLRAMEFEPADGKQITMEAMEKKIGQAPYRSPSVFNYYLPEFSPVGVIADHGLVAPESQLATAPFMVGFMNGITSLIENGLTSCDRGFGDRTGKENEHLCHPELNQDGAALHPADGRLTLSLEMPSTPAEAVDELSLLLTSGRLNVRSKAVITDAYEEILANKMVNLTNAKTAASSSRDDTSPANVINGVTLGWDVNNGCHKTATNSPPWWSVDMGESKDVTSVSVIGRSDCCAGTFLNGFDIFVDDTKCASNVKIATGEFKNVPCVASGSLVTIQRTKLSASVMILCEVQVFTRHVSSEGVYDSNPFAEALAMQEALKLIAVAPEYHATNQNSMKTTVRSPPPEQTSLGRRYKAVVVVFLEGGMDSFNMLIPHSDCTKPKENGQNGREPNDLYAEYARVRGSDMALNKEYLLPIQSYENEQGAKQPCNRFGIHPALPVLKELYDVDDALHGACICTMDSATSPRRLPCRC